MLVSTILAHRGRIIQKAKPLMSSCHEHLETSLFSLVNQQNNVNGSPNYTNRKPNNEFLNCSW